MKIGIIIPDNTTWIGGINYINRVVAEMQSEGFEILTFTFHKKHSDKYIYVKFNVIERIVSIISRIFLRRDFVYETKLNKFNIHTLLLSTPLGVRSKINTITWIPDFQVYKYPTYFSLFERIRRKISILHKLRHSTFIILSSESMKEDFRIYINKCFYKIRVIPFTLTTTTKVIKIDYNILSKYNIPNDYYVVPNQYWRHKNHIVLLNLLIRRKDINIVSTGDINDYRNKKYINEILNYINNNYINNYYILGIIPYEDTISLISQSKGLINPSLYEGWSTTVEEAKSLRKPVIASDINTHREQLDDKGFYFNPESDNDLEKQLDLLASNYVHYTPKIYLTYSSLIKNEIFYAT